MKIQSTRHYHIAYEDIICGKEKTFVLSRPFYSRAECDRAIEGIMKAKTELMNLRTVFVETSYRVVKPDDVRLKMEADFDAYMSKKVGAK